MFAVSSCACSASVVDLWGLLIISTKLLRERVSQAVRKVQGVHDATHVTLHFLGPEPPSPAGTGTVLAGTGTVLAGTGTVLAGTGTVLAGTGTAEKTHIPVPSPSFNKYRNRGSQKSLLSRVRGLCFGAGKCRGGAHGGYGARVPARGKPTSSFGWIDRCCVHFCTVVCDGSVGILSLVALLI